jgi:hypothetical protein
MLEDAGDPEFRGKTLRNHFEHFDERLGAWASGTPAELVHDGVLLDDVSALPPGSDILRTFHTTSYVVAYREERYPLRPVIEEARQLALLAQQRAIETDRQLRMRDALERGDESSFLREWLGIDIDRIEIRVGDQRSAISFG